MASLAAVDANSRMFEHEGAALLVVTIEADLLVTLASLEQTCGGGLMSYLCWGAMRVVAVGARHEAFLDAVLEGQRELGLDVTVATRAEFELRFSQQLGGSVGFVD